MDEITKDRLANLGLHFQVDDRPGVEAFLHAYPAVLAYVEQSVPQITKHFPDCDLRLVVEADEDEDGGAEDAAQKLFILIEVPEGTNDALGSLDRLDQDWSIDVCEATDDRLVIDLKY